MFIKFSLKQLMKRTILASGAFSRLIIGIGASSLLLLSLKKPLKSIFIKKSKK
jgi:hypothetical protein